MLVDGLDDFTSSDLLGLSHLFRVAAENGREASPGDTFVLVPTKDLPRLAALLLTECRNRSSQRHYP